MVQVRQLAEQYRELERRGVGVALISPQRPGETAALATRFDIPMDFYVDRNGAAAARVLDLVASRWGTGDLWRRHERRHRGPDRRDHRAATGKVVWVGALRQPPDPPGASDLPRRLDRAGIVAPS